MLKMFMHNKKTISSSYDCSLQRQLTVQQEAKIHVQTKLRN